LNFPPKKKIARNTQFECVLSGRGPKRRTKPSNRPKGGGVRGQPRKKARPGESVPNHGIFGLLIERPFFRQAFRPHGFPPHPGHSPKAANLKSIRYGKDAQACLRNWGGGGRMPLLQQVALPSGRKGGWPPSAPPGGVGHGCGGKQAGTGHQPRPGVFFHLLVMAPLRRI